MEDLIEHWHRLQYCIQAVENATVNNVGQRVADMEQERIIFNKEFYSFAMKNMEQPK